MEGCVEAASRGSSPVETRKGTSSRPSGLTVEAGRTASSAAGATWSPTEVVGSPARRVGLPETVNFGSVISGAVEESTVDLATELTIMIDSQRSYSANSKVFQTGSELMDVLISLKR